MITRVVKMTFKREMVSRFVAVFKEAKPKIESFDGCEEVKLMSDRTDERIYFTISKWKTPKDLENYRQSALFTETWARTKVNFDDKPLAWTLEQIL